MVKRKLYLSLIFKYLKNTYKLTYFYFGSALIKIEDFFYFLQVFTIGQCHQQKANKNMAAEEIVAVEIGEISGRATYC